MRRSTRSLCSLRLSLTIPWTAACAAPPPYLGNDHLPSKRPCVRHYHRSHQRWRVKGMVTDAARADVPHLSPGGRLRAPVLTANPRCKESNQGSWAPNTGIMVPSLGKPHIYSLMGSYKSSPAVVYEITLGSWGRRWTSHHTLHVPVTFGQAVSTGYNPTQASGLVASEGLNLKGGDTCFSIHDQHQFTCIFFWVGSWRVGKIG